MPAQFPPRYARQGRRDFWCDIGRTLRYQREKGTGPGKTGPHQNGHLFVRRNHINTVSFNLHPVFELDGFHCVSTLKQFGQHGFVGWVKVLDDDKSQAVVSRNMAKKLVQRLQPVGGSADTDDGKSQKSFGCADGAQAE